MSTKKKKIVLSAAENKQENAEKAQDMAEVKPSSVDTGKSVETKESAVVPEPAFTGIDTVLAKVDKGMLEKADLLGAGDIVRSFIQWGKSVDAKFDVVGGALQQLDKRFESMPTEDSIANKFMDKLKAEREKAVAAQQTRQQPLAVQNQPQQQEEEQQKGSQSEIVGLLKVLGMGEGGGGSTSDEYFKQLGMETASLSNFMTKEMFKTVMPQAFEEWMKAPKPWQKGVTK